MKLAEALLERKSLKQKIESLQSRLAESVMVQEGDKPVEDPQALMAELNEATEALETLIKQINATNNVAKLPDGVSVSEAIVSRDLLRLRRETLEQVAQSTSMRQNRYMRTEVRFVPTIDSAELRKRIDALSKSWRELDAQIQAVNWTTELAT
jgi:hypothetical protein